MPEFDLSCLAAGVKGLGLWGPSGLQGFRGSGFGVWGLGFRVWGSGFGVLGIGRGSVSHLFVQAYVPHVSPLAPSPSQWLPPPSLRLWGLPGLLEAYEGLFGSRGSPMLPTFITLFSVAPCTYLPAVGLNPSFGHDSVLLAFGFAASDFKFEGGLGLCWASFRWGYLGSLWVRFSLDGSGFQSKATHPYYCSCS